MTITVNGVDFTGDPCRVVEMTWNGRYVKAGERTIAHLFFTQQWLDKHQPGWYVYVVQSAYHSGYAPSAGTHDLDGVLDVYLINRTTGKRKWLTGQRWLRALGWFDWWRHSGSWLAPNQWHHHMISGGIDRCGCPIGSLVPGQIADYYARKSGLFGHIFDPTWHPKNIDATIFDFRGWLKKQEEDMGYNDWTPADQQALIKDVAAAVIPGVVAALLGATIESDNGKSTLSVRSALRQAQNAPGLIRRLGKGLGVDVDAPTRK